MTPLKRSLRGVLEIACLLYVVLALYETAADVRRNAWVGSLRIGETMGPAREKPATESEIRGSEGQRLKRLTWDDTLLGRAHIIEVDQANNVVVARSSFTGFWGQPTSRVV